ncbi:NAD(P)/FAD-dependent oxidoreductase [Gracilimonas sp.]|uniref:phytoene desaturase family protein n=1 Tax=Gracilimonas sp. TaxID=1974203 RepID=UPI0032EB6871
MPAHNPEYDAVIVGSGPNGLSAAVRLSQEGLKVLVLEAKPTIGGGTRTQEITEPGFLHDICAAVLPTTAGSPFLNSLNLKKYGLEFIQPDIPYAHPLDDGDAAVCYRSLEKTAESLGVDHKNYTKLFGEFVNHWKYLSEDIFGTLRIPKHPLLMARFGWYGQFSAKHLGNSLFKSDKTKALFAGCAAHSIIPLEKAFSASFGLVLGSSAHSVGWPIAKGGSASVTNALAALLEEQGGKIQTNVEVKSLADIPSSKTILFDLTPHQIVDIAGDQLPKNYRDKLRRYEYGPGAFKVDWALSEPVPWQNEECRKAGTLHLGGIFSEIAEGEKAVWEGRHHDKPYVLLSQPSLFDDTRAPEGKHTLWAYCHVPNGSTKDMTDIIENQIERFAPGFKDIIISKKTITAEGFEQYNPNYVGGDINGGAQFFKQLFGRPVLKWDPYKIPGNGLYICSSSTPPGGGVHGMCGYNAAQSVLKNEFGISSDKS